MQNELGEEHERITSPFDHTQMDMTRVHPRKSVFPSILLGLIVLVGCIGGTLWLSQLASDPTRTMETLPVSKYFDSPHTLSGSRFKAELRVEADLGFKEGLGRLMLFSTTEDSRPFAVLVPVTISRDLLFSKGQNYLAELEVKEGGLIYANSCHKN